MSEVFRCEDKETLVAYLYGEVDANVRREVERHLRTCTACTRETAGLQHAREDLQLWMPPEPELGFGIVQNASGVGHGAPAPVLTSSRWATLHGLPAWAQLAAAALFLAAAAAVANIQVRSTSEGVVVSTGWMTPAAVVAAPSAAPASDQAWRAALVSLEDNLRRELRQELRTEIDAQQTAIRQAFAAAPVPDAGDGGAVLRRVQAMIDASESRQRQEMALRFAQAERTWSTRWASDRATFNRQLGSLQGRTMAVQVGQQEIMNQFRLQRVSVPQPNQ
jgi:hypothetical protein